ncbi:MAG TPA: PAS domain-containing protein [Candidatus Cloacimonadota bacterium]|nr:PAS domain-containing protein [Candidatus Cloacimonadota bacterium]HPT72088.1 PAS domain-containing protein [Candidatus Cloacimonadota bacterium]
MDNFSWFDNLPVAITVSDENGVIISMNDKAGKVFASDGGKALIGTNLMDCHNPHSRAIIKDMMETARTNAYTIEKKGIKKLIYQTPWFKDGQIAGLVEISMEIPLEMPHFIRES